MTTGPANNMDIKRRNRANTLRCILNCERISQMELAQRLALSWPTVLQNVKELTESGLVCEVGQYESTGGRRARAYAPIADAKLAVGLNITKSHVSFVLSDLGGRMVRHAREKLPFALEEAYFRRLGERLEAFLDDKDAARRVLGVGVALPGIVDEARDSLAYSHVLGVRDFPLSRLAGHIPYQCRFINDANAAGLAEVYGKTAAENVVYLSLNNSVGGAILNEGKLYTGSQLRAGEFGHFTLIPGGKKCYCGKTGCMDAYCSAQVLSACADGSLERFFERLQKGDRALEAVWQAYLENVAVAINNLRMSFDCDVIVGGDVGAYLETFGQSLWKKLEERNTFERDASYLKLCRCKREASAMGAALVWIDAFIRTV